MVRITPIDYAMTAGVGFGFTRYSVWFQKPANAFQAGYTSGFDSMVLGEYQALSKDQALANQQLLHLWERGGNAVHAMQWPASHDRGYNETMTGAIRNLLEHHDAPRTVVTGGVSQIKAVQRGEQLFNLAAIGVGPNKRGLLKSLREDGRWEGSVYAVPFRTAIAVQELETRIDARGSGVQTLSVGPLADLEAGEQIVLQFTASDSRNGTAEFSVRHEAGGTLPGTSQTLALSADNKSYRFVLRAQLPADGCMLSVNLPASAQIKQIHAQRETEQVARPHRGIHTGVPHQGGMTFDLLPDA
ncbi:hypothetical protein SH580_05285 [Coraliomargarita algicola]|uniref:Uncharacterized protein n=1 Tax=Coraliomargarita algicola TaxID=3092156 RepID=A0ABZ0RPF6_9BACT|nr:hypothetical protein [Coraliomargarita sp. J2-16]WPJ97119.1 hypothetical protein SH580_05285 [Coraliomargarita sp. J2-16]